MGGFAQVHPVIEGQFCKGSLWFSPGHSQIFTGPKSCLLFPWCQLNQGLLRSANAPRAVLPSCGFWLLCFLGPLRHTLPVVQDTPSYEKKWSHLGKISNTQKSWEANPKSTWRNAHSPQDLGIPREKSPETQASSTSLHSKYKQGPTETRENRTWMRTELVIW